MLYTPAEGIKSFSASFFKAFGWSYSGHFYPPTTFQATEGLSVFSEKKPDFHYCAKSKPSRNMDTNDYPIVSKSIWLVLF